MDAIGLIILENLLRTLGWSDKDIFDATMQGMNMMSAGMIFKAFKMGKE